MADVHNRTRYLAGCRCETCKMAQSTYMRERRQKKNGEALSSRKLRSTTPPPPAESVAEEDGGLASGGSVFSGVSEEIAGFVGADDHPGLKATALALARILDTPSAIAQHAAAAGRLMDLLSTLGKGGKKKPSKLGELRGLEGGKSA